MKIKQGRKTITNEIAYIAGFFDGEGCIRIKKSNQSGNSYYLWVAITNSNKEILDSIKEIFGGSVRQAEKTVNKVVYHYLITCAEACDMLKTIGYFLREKRKQAKLGIEFHEKNHELTANQKSIYYSHMSELKRENPELLKDKIVELAKMEEK